MRRSAQIILLASLLLCSTGPAHAGPISNYCRHIQAEFQETWKPDPAVSKPVIINFSVDESGNVKDVAVSNDEASSGSAKAIDFVKEKSKLDPPPTTTDGKPLRLTVELTGDPKKIVVSAHDINYGPYMADVQRRIKKAWFPPKGTETLRVTVTFKISADGVLSDLKLDKSSGDEKADKAGLNAVTNAAPFKSLPDGSPECVDMSFTFDYNVKDGSQWKVLLRKDLQTNLTTLSSQTGVPAGWSLRGDNPTKYAASLDSSTTHEGKPSACIKSLAERISGFGTVMQCFLADRYRGKRLQLSAWLKAQDVDEIAALWMRVDGSEGKMLAFDNMENRPIKGTVDWKKYSVVLDVSDEAKKINFGFLLNGPGKLWASDIQLKEVGKDVPSTNIYAETQIPSTPVNLDFTGKKQ